MPMSKFPNRFRDRVSIGQIPVDVNAPGKVFWVDNSTSAKDVGIATGSDLNPGTFHQPLATIDAAINKCTASRGDIIYVKAGHAEAVTATSIVHDTAGVRIIGLGVEGNRPVLSFGVTSSNIAISGANCSLENMILKATVNAVVAGVTVSAAGVLVDVETQDTSA